MAVAIEDPSPGGSLTDIERQPDGIQKRLTVTFRDLSIRVTAPDAALGSTLLSAADPRQLLALFQKDQKPKRVGIMRCTSDLGL